MKPLLEVKALEITFFHGKQQTRCTDHVSFEVNPGEILCIVGESGCGKSITALSILGLLARGGRVTGGEILFQERNLLELNEKQLDTIRGSEISMIFQDIMYSLNPVFTVESQLTEAIRRHLNRGRREVRELAATLLKRTGISQPHVVLRKYPHQLSGGMRQRVMIAMALACRPRLLIADEPTTALDATIQLQILRLLKDLRNETGMAILFITHDLGVVAEMADRVVVMYAGQCVEEASAEQLLKDPIHPYTQALLRTVPGLHDDRSKRIFSIPGRVPEHYQEMNGCRFAPRCPYANDCTRQASNITLESCRAVRCCESMIRRRIPHAE